MKLITPNWSTLMQRPRFGWVWHCLNVVRQYEQNQRVPCLSLSPILLVCAVWVQVMAIIITMITTTEAFRQIDMVVPMSDLIDVHINEQVVIPYDTMLVKSAHWFCHFVFFISMCQRFLKLQMRFEFFVRVRPDVMYFALDQLPSKARPAGMPLQLLGLHCLGSWL